MSLKSSLWWLDTLLANRPLMGRASKVACFALGVFLASAVVDGLKPPVEWIKEKPMPRKVSVRAQAVTTPAAPVTPKKILPIHVDKAPAEKPKKLADPTPAVISEQPLPTLSQPAISPPPQPVPEQLPAIPGMGAPEAPTERIINMSDYPEQAGGSVLVLELTVNDQGVVVDSRILVPSYNTVADLTLALAAKGQRWTSLMPPLVPGEYRRLEIRVPYATDGTSTNRVLP